MVFVVRRPQGLTECLPPGGILKAAQYGAMVDAEGLLAEARARAADILATAEKDAEQTREDGFRQGMQDAMLETAERMIDNVQRTIDYYAAIEDTVVTLVITALRKILSEFDEGERVARVVKKALAAVRNQKTVTVRVSPAQLETVRQRVGDLLAAYPGIGFLDIVPDGRLTADNCILETEIGTVDASLEVQIQALHRAFSKQLGGGGR